MAENDKLGNSQDYLKVGKLCMQESYFLTIHHSQLSVMLSFGKLPSEK
jgi:hypothetical protein